MAMKPTSIADPELRRRWNLADDDPGPISLPNMQLPRGEARREDEARWQALEHQPERDEHGGMQTLDYRPERDAHGGFVQYGGEISGQEGTDMLAGGAGDDPLDEYPNRSPSPRLEPDIASLNNDAVAGPVSPARIEPDINAVLADRASRNVTKLLRVWPVPGDGKPAVYKAKGPNGHTYSDGRYSINGDYRVGKDGKPRAHKGIDLPAKIGSDVVAADHGVVSRVGTQRVKEGPRKGQKDGWGDYVVVDHGDGTFGRYAHLSPEGRPATGTHVKRGQKIGTVGGTGNAKTQGDHVHYEIRRSSTNAPMDPTEWMRRKRISVRNQMDD